MQIGGHFALGTVTVRATAVDAAALLVYRAAWTRDTTGRAKLAAIKGIKMVASGTTTIGGAAALAVTGKDRFPAVPDVPAAVVAGRTWVKLPVAAERRG